MTYLCFLKSILIAALFTCVISLMGCMDYQPSADEVDRQKQEQSLKEAQSEIGMPALSRFQEKKDLKTIYELRDRADLINYCYLFSEQLGKAIYVGKCIGYGIPYATQFSNPEKVTNYGHSTYAYLAIPQAEPNGLFMPATAEGTWVMMLATNGDIKVAYFEPRVIITPVALPNAIGGPDQSIVDDKSTLRNIGDKQAAQAAIPADTTLTPKK